MLIGWLTKQIKPIVENIFEELKPIIKEIAIAAAKGAAEEAIRKANK